jgi:6,7-dimethyl-8-ribityllumazine synthase
LETYIPCLFGVLTVLNKEQAIKRSTGTHNEGLSWYVAVAHDITASNTTTAAAAAAADGYCEVAT